MRKYNSLFFDLDDTLLDYSGDERIAIKETLIEFGQPFSDDIFILYEEVQAWPTFRLGFVDAKSVMTERFMRLLKALEIKADNGKMQDVFFEKLKKSHHLAKGASVIVRTLYNKGYKLYLTTNGFSEIQKERFLKSGLKKYFSGVFISEEIDVRKPSKAYFDYVFNRIPESDRKKVLIIGDAQTADVLGGLNSGIDTCWINKNKSASKYKATYSIKRLKELETILI